MGAFQAEVEHLLKDENGGDFTSTFKSIASIAELVKALPESETDPGAFWESDHEEIVKALPDDLAKAIREVSAWMKRLAKMKGSPGPDIARVLTFLGQVAGGKYPSPKPVTKAEEIPTEQEAKKALTEEMSKAITSVMEFMVKAANGKLPIPEADKDEVAKAVPADLVVVLKQVVSFLNDVVGGKYPYPTPGTEAKPAGGTPTPAKKSDGDGGAVDEEVPAVQVMDDGTVIVKGQPVSKGKKFTPTRTSAIKEVALSLIKLLGEVGDDSTHKALGDALKAITGEAATPPPAAGVQKSVEPDPRVVELEKQLKEVTEKMEKVLKERKAGAAIDDDKPKDAKVKKAEDDFWGTVI